jgi:hypothetical protein
MAMTAALCVLAAPATAGAAPAKSSQKAKKKFPVITKVVPKAATVGDTLTLYGRNFRTGKGTNSVAFKAEGRKAVFLRADISTRKQMKVPLTQRLERVMVVRHGAKAPTRFRVRALSSRFGKKFTSVSASPVIAPRPANVEPTPPTDPENPPANNPPANNPTPPPLPPADGDCDGDGLKNAVDPDDDDDLLADEIELLIGTDPCKVDTDGDGVEDGYEYKSAVDLNDDEYANPQDVLPYPAKRPYPNPLFAGDANIDFDGDSLTLTDEFKLWVYTFNPAGLGKHIKNPDAKLSNWTLFPLTYSDGEQYSMSERRGDGRRVPTLSRQNYSKQQSFLAHAQEKGRRKVWLEDGLPWWDHDNVRNEYGLLDFNRDGAEADTVLGPPVPQDPGPGLDDAYRTTEKWYFDFDNDGYLSDDERDEDADGLTNFDELYGRMSPSYWEACYSGEAPYHVPYAGTSHVNPDSDGDGLRDGADDQDHDDIPNVMELSRIAASGLNDRQSLCKPLEGLPEPPETHHPDRYGRVNPFNPCLPAAWSRTCLRHPKFEDAPAPFDGSLDWVSLQ